MEFHVSTLWGIWDFIIGFVAWFFVPLNIILYNLDFLGRKNKY